MENKYNEPSEQKDYIIAAKKPDDLIRTVFSVSSSPISKETAENSRNSKSAPKAGKIVGY